jgi:radical SAM-linked protein
MAEVLSEFYRRYQDDRIAISLPSLRPETMTPELAEQVASVRKSAFTFAPEAGSERLRRVINKGNTEEDLLAAVRAAAQAGWRNLKFYFMIGLPSETDEDLEAIIRLAKAARAAARDIRGDAGVTVSVSTFVPKPHTPLQWEAQIDIDQTRRRQSHLRDVLRKLKIPFRYHSPEQSFVEGVLSRGDRRLAAAIVSAARQGCRLDAWTEQFDMARWSRAFAEVLEPHGLEATDFLATREPEQLLPWDHIDVGVLKKFLLRDRKRALREVGLEDCALADQCVACGACDIADPYLEKDPKTGKRVVRLQPRVFPAGEMPSERHVATPAPGRTASTVVARSRVRFRFAKLGAAVHLSHLDTANQILRAVRRSGLPVLYTEGHTPRPRVGFSPACPTGVTSEAEYFEADCAGFPDPDRYIGELNRFLPEGLRVRAGEELEAKTPPFNEILAATTFRVSWGEAPAMRSLAAFFERDSVPVRVLRKRKGKLVEARNCIEEAHSTDGDLLVTLAFGRGGTLKVSEAVATLLGREVLDGARIHKEAVRLRDRPLPQGRPAGPAPGPEVIDLTDLGERRTQKPLRHGRA